MNKINNGFLNFSVGPVLMDQEILEIGKNQIPYFRTEEFSKVMLENEKMMKNILYADEDTRAVFLTSSGTGAMEAAVINILNKKDKVLIINGGSFGERFVKLCSIYEVPYFEVKLNFGEALTYNHLKKYKDENITAFLVNIHETSTGILYDIDLISKFCKMKKCMLIVDAISSFLADEIKMKKYNINVLIVSSQKALALPPGISIIMLDKKAISIVRNNNLKSMYFNLNDYLKNGERGQTPFTPAVSILLQLNKRLKTIEKLGVENIINNTKALAYDFRNKIKVLPFKVLNENSSNAVTTLEVMNDVSAYNIFKYLKNKYNIFICPNGGDFKDKIFRVGHIGSLSFDDNNKLINAFIDMKKRGII